MIFFSKHTGYLAASIITSATLLIAKGAASKQGHHKPHGKTAATNLGSHLLGATNLGFVAMVTGAKQPTGIQFAIHLNLVVS